MDKTWLSAVSDHLLSSFQYVQDNHRELFSHALCRSYLRLLQSGGDYVNPSVLRAVGTLVSSLSIDARRLLADWGLWPLLVALLGHRDSNVVLSTSETLKSLSAKPSTERYADFLEANIFEELIKRLPRPELINLELPVVTDGESPWTDFTALDTTWSVFFRFPSAPKFLL
jgi:hypothetical protein